jgi:3-mercaptopyruvate sulfurtransferase SseA
MLGRLAALACSLAVAFWAYLGAEEEEPRPQALGKSLYDGYCGRCHGDDGDLLDYYGVIPLAGIGRRPPVGLVGRFRGESFLTRGEEFSGARAKALAAHLATLRGAKGFRDPGWLWSPYLLDRKNAFIEECRVLDVRRSEAYSGGHIPNAVSVDLESLHHSAGHELDAKPLFDRMGIGPLTQVVVYDEIGGPDSAWLWWKLLESGHPYVAVLDGGWERWVGEGFQVSTLVPKLPTGGYGPSGEEKRRFGDGQLRDVDWNWSRLRGPTGLRSAEEIQESLHRMGIQPGAPLRLSNSSAREAAFLVLALRLLGEDRTLEVDDDGHPLVR